LLAPRQRQAFVPGSGPQILARDPKPWHLPFAPPGRAAFPDRVVCPDLASLGLQQYQSLSFTMETNGDSRSFFKGNSQRPSMQFLSVIFLAIKSICLRKLLLQTLRVYGIPIFGKSIMLSITELQQTMHLSQESFMKLPLISASIVVYALLATAWICYTELVALY
jgi:hypothetical protein